MKSNKLLKISLLLTTLASIALSQSACLPQQSATIQPLISPTAEVLPIQQDTQIPTAQPTATSTPLPSATSTPEPVADLHDLSTWPVEMQEYFNRLPEEWNNPTRQYVSDVEFHRFVQQARRDFLTANGVADAGSMNQEKLFMEYLRLTNKIPIIMTLSPLELREMVSDPQNVGASFIHFDDESSTMTEGLFVNYSFRDNDEAFEIMKNRVINYRFTINLFGQPTEVARAFYQGVMGDEIGLFLLPGINQNEGIGVLVHYVNESGRHCYLPLATHFEDEVIRVGDIVVLSGLGTSLDETEVNGAHINPKGRADMAPVTLDDLMNNIGLKIQIYPDTDNKLTINQSFPFQLGLEGGQRFVFNQPELLPPIVYPWSQP